VVEGSHAGLVAVVSEDGRFGPHESEILDILCAGATTALALAGWPKTRQETPRWDEALEAIEVGLCLVEPDGTVSLVNRMCRSLVGSLERPWRSGEHWTALFPSSWHDTIAPMLTEASDGGHRELEIENRRVCVRPFPAGERSRVLVLEDHSERHRLEEQVVQSAKMSAIGQLIAGVAHDLNNPLASVVGFADYLMESPSLPEQYREPLRVIQQEAERSADIVKNLLTFARKQEGPWRPTRVPALLEATQKLMHNELGSRRVELLMEIEPDLPSLRIEPNRMQQVIVNLVTNAAHALTDAGRQGRVLIRARRWSDGVAIEVSDNGPGIPPEHHGRIFEPFYTTKAQGSGTGLGLSISQSIVREHGGHISLVGSSSRGTVFRVELPGVTGGAPAAASSDEQRVSRALRILVVDDEPHILHYMTATLESWGHTVVVAHDGGTALTAVSETEFDVIVTDLRMPGVNGRQFYQRLQQDRPDLARRVVFSTGDTVRDDTLAFLEQQDQPCLLKPFSLVALRQALARIVDQPENLLGTSVPQR
jgi:two-component system NtrC family sensor kinase